MDVDHLVALLAACPWIWIMMKFMLFPNIVDLIPLAIFAYLLVSLKRAIQDEIKPVENDEKLAVDCFSQTELVEYNDQAVQVQQGKSDASTQTMIKELLDKETQSVRLTKDASTSMDVLEISTTDTDDNGMFMDDKGIQTAPNQSKNQETQTTCHLVKEKKVKMQHAIPIPERVFVPEKRGKPKPTNPLTKVFKTFRKKKYDTRRSKIKFSLDEILEVEEHENELQLRHSQSEGELKISEPIAGLTDTDGSLRRKLSFQSDNLVSNHSHLKKQERMKGSKAKSPEKAHSTSIPDKVNVPVKRRKPKATIPPTKEFMTYHRNKHDSIRKKFKFIPILDTILEVEEPEIENMQHHIHSEGHMKISESIARLNGTEASICGKLSFESDDFESNHSHLQKDDGIKGSKGKSTEKNIFDSTSEVSVHDNESALSDSSPSCDVEFQKSPAGNDVTEQVHYEYSSLDDFHTNGLHSKEEGEKTAQKEKNTSFFKKKFKNIKKLFKK